MGKIWKKCVGTFGHHQLDLLKKCLLTNPRSKPPGFGPKPGRQTERDRGCLAAPGCGVLGVLLAAKMFGCLESCSHGVSWIMRILGFSRPQQALFFFKYDL